MARTKTVPRELRRKEPVVAAVAMPGIPEGTAGKVILVEGFTWIRYWVRFANGVVRGSLNRDKLARPDEYADLLARRERGDEPEAETAGNGAAAADAGTAAASGGDEVVVNGVPIPALLLDRTKKRLEALGVTR
jgi:hypothetical protein